MLSTLSDFYTGNKACLYSIVSLMFFDLFLDLNDLNNLGSVLIDFDRLSSCLLNVDNLPTSLPKLSTYLLNGFIVDLCEILLLILLNILF